MKIFQGALAALSLFRQAVVVQAADFERPADNVFDGDTSSTRLIIGYKNENGRGKAKGNAAKVHLELGRQRAVAVTMNENAANGLRNDPDIAYVEVDEKRYPLRQGGVRGGGPTSFRDRGVASGRKLQQTPPYGITTVEADQLHSSLSALQTKKKVCIIDSGYGMGHPDLPTTGVDGYNGNLRWAEDGDGHGTHVAGTIAAMDNGLGVVGVAPGIPLYIVRVFGDDGLWAYSSTLADAANRCVAGGADIISMSLGGGGPTNTENNAFINALNSDVLSIAAAGNGGTGPNVPMSYPASYDSVISVAATDSSDAVASFSQRNAQVELSAPGVDVLSTVSGLGGSLNVGGTSYAALIMAGSPAGTATAPLFRCSSVDELGSPGDCVGASGKVCLIQRGTITFAEKVVECQARGGVAAVIYNNVAGSLSGTLGDTTVLIQAVGISDTDGADLLGKIGSTTTVAIENTASYAYYSGTSMATPHVSGVAALVWSHCSGCTATEVREALQNSALDLGATGRDDAFGYGLVKANAALVELQTSYTCCGGSPPPPTTDKWSCSKNPEDPLTVCQESYVSFTGCTTEGVSCGNGPKVCHKYEPSYCQGTGPVTTTVAPPSECNNNNVCDPGEDCNGCPDDCAGIVKGPPSSRHCCGDGIQQAAETDAAICDGNI